MGYWNKFLRKDKKNCFQDATLLVRVYEDIKEIPFKFSSVNDDVLLDAESSIPMTYDKRTKAIFVYDYKLPFVNGARIRFADNSTMTISSIVKVVDEKKAFSDGEGIIGLNIYLG